MLITEKKIKGLLGKQRVCKYVYSLLTTMKSTQQIEIELNPNYQNSAAN